MDKTTTQDAAAANHTVKMQWIVFVVTILFTRIFLYLTWDSTMIQVQRVDSWHHIYTGFVLLLVSPIIHPRFKYILRAVSIGLIVDEVIHIVHIFGLINAVDYWSWQSWCAVIVGMAIYWIILRD